MRLLLCLFLTFLILEVVTCVSLRQGTSSPSPITQPGTKRTRPTLPIAEPESEPEPETNYVRANVTCGDKTRWFKTWVAHPIASTGIRVYGVKCVNNNHPARGIMATFNDGTVTDGSWKCTHDDPGRDWQNPNLNFSRGQDSFSAHVVNKQCGQCEQSWITDGYQSPTAQWISAARERPAIFCRKIVKAGNGAPQPEPTREVTTTSDVMVTQEDQPDPIHGNITCDNTVTFYTNDGLVLNPSAPGAGNWKVTNHVNVSANTKVYGIQCSDSGVVAGIIASFSDGTVTDRSWRCTYSAPDREWLHPTFNDSTWEVATAIHTNNVPSPYWGIFPNIASSAQWIWTSGWRGQHKRVHCRKVVTGTTGDTSTTIRTTKTTVTTTPAPLHQWGAWGIWNKCDGGCSNGTQRRSRRCIAVVPKGLPCRGSRVQERRCTPTVDVKDCSRCKLDAANIGYISDCLDNHVYYQCQKTDDSFALTRMVCGECTMWDPLKLTCVRDPDADYSECVHEEESEEGSGEEEDDKCMFAAVEDDPTKYLVIMDNGDDVEMSCPPGTVFDLQACRCVAGGTAPVPTEPAVCVTFEGMTAWSKYSFNEGGTHIGNHGGSWPNPHVQMKEQGCVVDDKCGFFTPDENSYLTIPSLSNAFHGWSEFTISFWMKPANRGRMGILTNGVNNMCNSAASVSIEILGGYVRGYVATNSNNATVNGRISRSRWTHVVLTKNSGDISLHINGYSVDSDNIGNDDLQRSHCAMIIGIDNNYQFYGGLLDNVCFYKNAMSSTWARDEYEKVYTIAS